ncbi:hypothetical protein DAPPUDRAFT_192128 [Daphnia pulex]|uniref:Ig-like domain-containing protein n=1 Tax=Daphnia pulex TaxID=6669 RepID=E9FYA1_DAPPU|nr:hypothetical protein DAPPUDRAFT_192128 [Daphnia pulex]|eukprot:EFX87810.1 hypothetical protein DAPPUDRAFT_192128 [Daphnia pulex]
MESRDPASSGGRFGGGGGNHFLDDDEDDDGDGVVWPTLSLSPRFQHIPPPPPPVVYGNLHKSFDIIRTPLPPKKKKKKKSNLISFLVEIGPFFEPEFATNISVLAGQTVLLQCRVMDLGDRVVSWVRQSDLAILASGGVSHTSDNRITASADETLTDWELQIAEAQTKDSGLYECQVNTEPKINWPVTVHVEVALDSPRGGISLETERTVTGMSSKLLLTRATVQDGGNYTCAPPGAQPADVTVHVLNGKSFRVNSPPTCRLTLSLCRLAENTSLFIDGFFLCVVVGFVFFGGR